MEENNKKNKPFTSLPIVIFAWELLKIALIAFVIVAPIRYFLFQPFIVSGDSMVPNFHSGDYLIVDEISYKFSQPQRGDVIVFNFPLQPSERFIKRIIGLPGETVQVKDGNVYIISNGKTSQVPEKYLPRDLKTYGPNGDLTVTVNPNEYFVMGDNRDRSYDSRMWGLVPQKNIIGKAFLRIFPVTALSAVSSPLY
ncbi:MAG: signal peptidase I [Candidatus Staskawiczbacteria bacterium]|nr:signal peptidase I [Candidatus Staskawiczbacteria bacterium]